MSYNYPPSNESGNTPNPYSQPYGSEQYGMPNQAYTSPASYPSSGMPGAYQPAANQWSQQPVGYTANPYNVYPGVQGDRRGGMALAGMILGIISMVAWLLPFVGLPVSVVGLILSALGRASVSRRTMATVGLVLSILALALTLCNAAAGVYMNMHTPSY